MPQDRTDRTARTRVPFVRALAETFNITDARALAGISRDTAYRWRASDRSFAAAWTEALDTATDALKARRRAVEGVPKSVVSAGRVVLDATGAPLMVRRYSDRLLEVLLRAQKPDKYGHQAKGTVQTDYAAMADTQLDAFIREKLVSLANGLALDGDGADGLDIDGAASE